MVPQNLPHRVSLLVLLLSGALLLTASCSDRYADAVILDPEVTDARTRPGDPFDGGSGGPEGHDPGLDDLCRPCANIDDCGNSNDLCLQLPGQDGFYCGMDCDRNSDCPEGYECTNVQFSPDLEQCTPSSGSCDDPAGINLSDLPGDQEARDYVLDLMNDLRRDADLELLRQSDCLEEIASDSLDEWEFVGSQGTKFRRECLEYIPDCRCNWQIESQAWALLEQHNWEAALQRLFEQADDWGNEFHTVYDDQWSEVGIAVDFVSGYVLLSVEFSP